MEIVRRGSCTFPWFAIWSFKAYGSSFLPFLFELHLWLRIHGSHISIFFLLENNLLTYLSHFLLKPIFFSLVVGAILATSILRQRHPQQQLSQRSRQEEGCIVPPWSLPWEPASFAPFLSPRHFMHLWFPKQCFIIPVRKLLLTDCGEEEKINEKWQGQTRLFPLTVCSPLIGTLLHLPPILPPSLSLHHPLCGAG